MEKIQVLVFMALVRFDPPDSPWTVLSKNHPAPQCRVAPQDCLETSGLLEPLMITTRAGNAGISYGQYSGPEPVRNSPYLSSNWLVRMTITTEDFGNSLILDHWRLCFPPNEPIAFSHSTDHSHVQLWVFFGCYPALLIIAYPCCYLLDHYEYLS